MSSLTARQKEELHLALLDYLHTNNLTASFEALNQELGLADLYNADGKQKYSGLLEKKWTSVLRLQKKIMEHESKIAELTEELSSTPARRTSSVSDSIPQAPAKLSLTGHRSAVTRVSFHPVFALLASASEDATIRLWDHDSGEHERTLKGHTKAVADVQWNGKGDLLATLIFGDLNAVFGEKRVSCSADMSLKLWDSAAEYSCIRTFYGHDHSVSSVAFTPDGDTLISASRDTTIKVWEVASGFCTRTIVGHDDWVRSALPSPDGALLVSCANDQSVRLWDITTGECRGDLRGHEHVVECVAFAPDASYPALLQLGALNEKDPHISGRFIASGSRDKTIKIWDTVTNQSIFTLAGHDNWLRGLVFHPSGKYLLSVADDKTLKVWDLATGRCLRSIDGEGNFLTCVDFCRHAPVAATGGADMTVKIWKCS
ncbi:Positively regulates the activity of the minus-end directed microtubule motor protein dynein [Rhizophlyctis rosea]|nr:Positively regulates the activity of the minus-end directed microtubule motor protein dynein [Rhizophlyctis rosea]